MCDVIGLMGYEYFVFRLLGRLWEKRVDLGGKYIDCIGKRCFNKDVVVKVQIRVKDSCVCLCFVKLFVVDSFLVSFGLKGIYGYGFIFIKL